MGFINIIYKCDLVSSTNCVHAKNVKKLTLQNTLQSKKLHMYTFCQSGEGRYFPQSCDGLMLLPVTALLITATNKTNSVYL